MPKITHIDHIAIATDDLDKSLAFFTDQLGLTCSHTETLEDRGIKVAMLPIGDTKIELIAPIREGSEVSGFLKKKGPGIHHICLASKDVAADMKELSQKGVRLTTDGPTDGAHGCKVGFIHPKSSGGVLVELNSKDSGGREKD